MIAIIFFCVLLVFIFIALSIITIVAFKEDGVKRTLFDVLFWVIVGGSLAFIIGIGITVIGILKDGKLSKKDKENYLLNKQILEDNLSRKDKYFFTYLDKAEEHNEKVNEHNNYWYRITIEDRSEYMIDIDYYKSTLIKESE